MVGVTCVQVSAPDYINRYLDVPLPPKYSKLSLAFCRISAENYNYDNI